MLKPTNETFFEYYLKQNIFGKNDHNNDHKKRFST